MIGEEVACVSSYSPKTDTWGNLGTLNVALQQTGSGCDPAFVCGQAGIGSSDTRSPSVGEAGNRKWLDGMKVTGL